MKRNGTIIFDFMVQVRKEVPEEEIENASTIWAEKDFRFVRVAAVKIHCPQIYIDTTDAIARCEKMAFTPWHCLVEHQPIGGISSPMLRTR